MGWLGWVGGRYLPEPTGVTGTLGAITVSTLLSRTRSCSVSSCSSGSGGVDKKMRLILLGISLCLSLSGSAGGGVEKVRDAQPARPAMH